MEYNITDSLHMVACFNRVILWLFLQSGEYEIPEWLSPGSVGMISQLLQVSVSRVFLIV